MKADKYEHDIKKFKDKLTDLDFYKARVEVSGPNLHVYNHFMYFLVSIANPKLHVTFSQGILRGAHKFFGVM